MRTRGERSKHRRSAQLEFLENRSLLSRLVAGGPAAEVRSGHDTVPFKGGFEGDRIPDPNNPLSITIEATGQATHWGKFGLHAHHTLVPTDPSHVAIHDGEATITLASGDLVYATYTGTGTFTFDPITHKPIAIDFELTLTLTKGTGRYADGVSGTIYSHVRGDLVTNKVTGTFEDGSFISTVGSSKGP